MVNFWEAFEVVVRDFDEHGISVADPGFYDHPSFVAVESRNAGYLNNYARFVQHRTYDERYLARARREIPAIAEMFQAELIRNGRLGACVDASMALSRILEREGFWNYCAKGSLKVEIQSTAGATRSWFWAFDVADRPFAAGHAWIYAPPFSIIDITIRQQPYRPHEADLIPEKVLAEDPAVFGPAIVDIVSPQYRAFLRANGVSNSRMLETANRDLPRFLATFPSYLIQWRRTRLGYISVGVGASDSPLEQITNMVYDGRTAFEVYRDIIRPRLIAIRQTT